MRVIPHIQFKNLNGLADKVVGLGKEVAGELFDEQWLIEAGTAQQGKGTEKLQAIRQQVKADAHREKARRLEDKQRQEQSTKAS